MTDKEIIEQYQQKRKELKDLYEDYRKAQKREWGRKNYEEKKKRLKERSEEYIKANKNTGEI